MGVTPWFEKGLQFSCTQCGKCCTGSSGYVFLSPSDIQRLSRFFSLEPALFLRKYTRIVQGEPALLDHPRSDACIFLQDNQCSVYSARPVQCQTYPWWPENLHSLEHWQEAKKHCEGIDHPLASPVEAQQIEQQFNRYLDNLLEQNFQF